MMSQLAESGDGSFVEPNSPKSRIFGKFELEGRS